MYVYMYVCMGMYVYMYMCIQALDGLAFKVLLMQTVNSAVFQPYSGWLTEVRTLPLEHEVVSIYICICHGCKQRPFREGNTSIIR